MMVMAGISMTDIALAAQATEGFVACGGNHFTRNSATEEHRTRYNIRNPNFSGTIIVTNVLMYNGNGVLVFNGNPSDPNFKKAVPPLQTSRFTTDEIGAFLPSADRPLITFIGWRSVNAVPVEEPIISGVNTGLNTTTGFRVAHHNVGCRNVPAPGAP